MIPGAGMVTVPVAAETLAQIAEDPGAVTTDAGVELRNIRYTLAEAPPFSRECVAATVAMAGRKSGSARAALLAAAIEMGGAA